MKKRYPGMYSYYQREIGKAKARFQELLNDVDDEILTGLESDGTISILDIQGVGRDVLPKEESVESSRIRRYEVVERLKAHYERCNEFEIETTGDDDLDRDLVVDKINNLNQPYPDDMPELIAGGYEFQGTDSDETEIFEIDKTTGRLKVE